MDVRRTGSTPLAMGLAFSELSLTDLWGRYLALGGTHNVQEMAAYMNGVSKWPAAEHDIAAQALNQYFTEHGLDHPVAYSDEL